MDHWVRAVVGHNSSGLWGVGWQFENKERARKAFGRRRRHWVLRGDTIWLDWIGHSEREALAKVAEMELVFSAVDSVSP